MKVHQIVEVRGVIAANAKQKMPARTAYKIARFMRDTEADERFYHKRIGEIVEAYGEKDSAGEYVRIDGNVKIKEADNDVFKKEMDELYNLESDVVLQFDINDFDGLELSVAEMILLCNFINKEA
jgi:hypothetical protein